MKKILIPFLWAAALLGQTSLVPTKRIDPKSPNKCPVYDVPMFRWTHMAIRPVDVPITDFEVLTRFLAPSNAEEVVKNGAQPLFNKAWQKLAREGLHWTDQQFSTWWFAAQQGEGSNWKREMIPPCEVLGDMMFGIPPSLVGRPTLVDFVDNGAREAWVYPINDQIEALFFKDCSNPSYRIRIPVPVTAEALPPPREEIPRVVDACPNIPGIQPYVPPNMDLDEKGNCVLKPPVPPPVINVPQQPAPIVNIPQQLPPVINVPKQPAPIINVSPAPVSCPAPQVTCKSDHPINITVQPAKVEVMPSPVQRIEIVQKHPWDEHLYWISGSAFHGVGIAWMVRNWNIRGPSGTNGKDGVGINGTNGKDGGPGPQGPQGPPGPPGTNGFCAVVQSNGTVIMIDCSKIGGGPPPRP